MNIEWDILNMRRFEEDGFVNVVVWLLKAEKKGEAAERRGRSMFRKTEEHTDITPFSELTKEQVIDWVKGDLGDKLDKMLERIEHELDTRINRKNNPPKPVVSGTPWE